MNLSSDRPTEASRLRSSQALTVPLHVDHRLDDEAAE
jgi:hypothetical protein